MGKKTGDAYRKFGVEQEKNFFGLTEEEKDTLVSEVRTDFDKRRNDRRSLELQWRLNMNFLAGNQYAEITPNGDVDDYGKFYFWQEREVFNHIAPIMETRLAKIARVKCGVSARPFSNDEGDIKTAKLTTAILKAVTEENHLSKLVNSATAWSEICGSVFYKVLWNEDKGTVVAYDKTGKAIREGDVDIIVCPPYEIFPDSNTAEDIDDLQSIIHAKAYRKDDVFLKWGVEVKGSDVDVFALDTASVAGGFGYSANVPTIGYECKNDYCIVIERYERPNKEYPNGRLVTVCEDKLLYLGDLPYENGNEGKRCFPFARQICMRQVGNFFGTTIVERMIPVQRAYNAVKNRKHEFINRLAMGVLAVEDGSIDTDNLEEEGLSPGKILIYRQGSTPPVMMNLGSVPAELTIEEERLMNEFMTISGISEFSKYGKIPANLTSGVALSLLSEQDDSKVSMSAEFVREAVLRIGEQVLRLYRQCCDGARVKRISGDNGDMILKAFNASKLQVDDLVFDTENELSDTPSNRKNMVLELVKMGLLYDENGRLSPRMRIKILEMLGMGNWENSLDIEEQHRAKAQGENENVEGIEDRFLEVDNHELHIEEHTKALICKESKLSQSEKRALLEHIKRHKQYVELKEIGI